MNSIAPLHIHRTDPTGTAAGPPVVLLHGFTASGAADFPEARWASPLADAGRTSLVIDLPGHGQSPSLPEGGVGTSVALAAIADAIDSQVEGPIDLVGYSLGARLAWDLTGRGLTQVNRLVLGGLSAQEPFGAVDVEAAKTYFAGGATPQDPLTAMMSQMMAAPGADSASLLSLVAGMGREPFDPAAAPPTVPTLVLAGQDDPMTEGLEQVAGLLPDARLERVPGDHVAVLHGEDFRRRTGEFLHLDLA